MDVTAGVTPEGAASGALTVFDQPCGDGAIWACDLYIAAGPAKARALRALCAYDRYRDYALLRGAVVPGVARAVLDDAIACF